jgi:hypothetical protein
VRRHLIWLAGSAVASFALVWLYVVAFPLAYHGDTYVDTRVQQRRLAACDLGQVAVFGDSSAEAAIVPNLISVSTSNFALPGTKPIETWFAVERAMRCPVPPRVVVIAHSAHMFTEPDLIWSQDGLDAVLDLDERREVERVAAQLHDPASLEPVPADGLSAGARDWAYEARFPPMFFASLVDAVVAVRWSANRDLVVYLGQTRGHRLFGKADGSSQLSSEGEMTGFKATALVDYYFTKTLGLLDAREVEVIYLSPPLNQTTHDRIGDGLAAEFRDYLRRTSRGLRHVHIMDDVLPCWPDAFFGDKAHLNGPGAEAYSREVDALLRDVIAGKTVEGLPGHCQPRNAVGLMRSAARQ